MERPELRVWWRDQLGAVPDPDGSWSLGPVRETTGGTVSGTIRQILLSSYGSELTTELLRPADAPPTGVLVVVPFYDAPALFGEPTARTRLHDRDPRLHAHGLRLAEAGHSVLAVPWWFEQVAAADPATAGAKNLDSRYGPAAERHRREQPMTALGRSIADVMLALTAALDSGLVDGLRPTAFGHSLGGKLAMHLAALDTRIEAAVAHEPGLGFSHSNWDAPWYLDGDIPTDRDQGQLLALVAPRPFLLVGGGASDGVQNLDLARSAAAAWPEGVGLDLLLHNGGHPVPHFLMASIGAWLSDGEILARTL